MLQSKLVQRATTLTFTGMCILSVSLIIASHLNVSSSSGLLHTNQASGLVQR